MKSIIFIVLDATENDPSIVIPSVINEGGLPTNFISKGVVNNWYALERFWDEAFRSQLTKRSEAEFFDHKILLTEQPSNGIQNRNKMTEILFEQFHFGALNYSNEALLTLYAQGALSGFVVDVGYDSIRLSSVIDGFSPHYLTSRLNFGGKDITSYLLSLLRRQGNHMYSKQIKCEAENIKETLCYAAIDPEEERRLARETTTLIEIFNLSDGKSLKIGQERFESVEAVFDPSLVDIDCTGLSDSIFQSIQKSDIDYRATLMKNIFIW